MAQFFLPNFSRFLLKWLCELYSPLGKNIKKSVLQNIKNLKTPFDHGGYAFSIRTYTGGMNLDIWKFQYRHPLSPTTTQIGILTNLDFIFKNWYPPPNGFYKPIPSSNLFGKMNTHPPKTLILDLKKKNNIWFLYSALPSSWSLLKALYYRVLLPQRPLQSRDITSIGAAILMVLHERSTLYTSIKYHIQIWWSSQCRYWSLLSTTGTDHCSVDRWP